MRKSPAGKFALTGGIFAAPEIRRSKIKNSEGIPAKFDGTPVFTAGDPGKTMAALKLIDANTIQETDTRNGKVTDVTISKVSADGKTMHVVDHDKLHGTETTYTAEKKYPPFMDHGIARSPANRQYLSVVTSAMASSTGRAPAAIRAVSMT